jgi:uncharacterized membrane protein YedE/YeeE
MEGLLFPLIGGVLIGLSSSLMLWGLGRITGISGIYSSLFSLKFDNFWKYSFLLGLLVGGIILHQLYPNELFDHQIPGSTSKVIIAGLLVGFGTRLGNGCTSGHGVCGIARLSARSIIATLTFILVAVAVVGIERFLV